MMTAGNAEWRSLRFTTTEERLQDSHEYAESVLRFDPENEKAQHLLISSKKLQLDKNNREYPKA